MYKSGFEKKLAKQLEERGIDFRYEHEKYEYVLVKEYTPDFFLPNGIIVEAKGKFTSEDRRKHLCVKQQHPHLDIRLVFMRNNKLRKNSKTTYSMWAEKNDYEWAIGGIPESWLKEEPGKAKYKKRKRNRS